MSKIYLWLDDLRPAPTFRDSGVDWLWVKTAQEAIDVLRDNEVIFASLDHDLSDEHYNGDYTKHNTGLDVLDFLEEFGHWPEDGIRIHTMNTSRKPIMLLIVERYYNRTFQYQIKGQYTV